MNENKNSDLSYQIVFIKIVPGLIIWRVLAWISDYWFVAPFAETLSFPVTDLIGYFYLSSLKKLRFFRWTLIVILITGCFAGVYCGSSLPGASRIRVGFTLAVLGILSFFLSWVYLRIIGGGLKTENKDDIMTSRAWLLWSGLSGIGIILLGVCVALGFFD